MGPEGERREAREVEHTPVAYFVVLAPSLRVSGVTARAVGHADGQRAACSLSSAKRRSAPGELVEMPHIEAAIRVPIERQDLLHLERRRAAARGLPAAVVEAQGAVRFKPRA